MANFDVSNAKFNNEVKKLEITDPCHADTFNKIFNVLLNNDVALQANTLERVRSVRINMIAMAIEVETLKGATLTGVDANIFTESFINIDDIKSLNGALKFDKATQKVYLL